MVFLLGLVMLLRVLAYLIEAALGRLLFKDWFLQWNPLVGCDQVAVFFLRPGSPQFLV